MEHCQHPHNGFVRRRCRSRDPYRFPAVSEVRQAQTHGTDYDDSRWTQGIIDRVHDNRQVAKAYKWPHFESVRA